MAMDKSGEIPGSEITPESVFLNRRRLLGASVALPAALMLSNTATGAQPPGADPLTPEEIVTSYNNFYEFGTDKSDPAKHAHQMTVDPWSVEITGACAKRGRYAFEDVIKGLTPEERIYRFRCVEAWSMVVPWLAIPLKDILARFEPTSAAKYVEFTTLHRPSEMRGQRSMFSGIDWPYVEGLRMDEAMHPLTVMATGLYGKPLPNQNGAPWRLVVPWKYGFKSIKSVVKIRFTERQPKNTWNLLAPREYGFYANVNPAVDHPRWSQATERRLPSSLFNPNRRDTLLFNGYAEEVAGLYRGMDLRRYY
jgi:methionine sulfoxide reductase catalytic subunit